MDRATAMLDEAWAAHYSTTAALIPAGKIQRKIGDKLLPDWDDLERLVNKPNELPWVRLFDGALATEDEHFLRSPFYEIADAFEPWDGYSRNFTPQPATDVRLPGADDIGEVVWEMYRGVRKVGIEQLTRAVNDNLQAREESKSMAMRSLHVFRRALPGAGRGGRRERRRLGLPAHQGAARAALPQPAHVAGRDPAGGVRRGPRRRRCRTSTTSRSRRHRPAAGRPRLARPSCARPPASRPAWSRGIVTTIEQAAAGVDHDEPVILVCESADSCIQTLLPGSAGLITLRGSMLSHISTLAREYGIPAVVNHPLAETLKAGQQVLLNGNTGEVEVLA